MKTLLLVVAVLCLCGIAVKSATIHAVREAEFEVLHLDYPSFIHALHHNPATNTIYAFGEGTFRQINHGYESFEAVDNLTIANYNHPWIDLRVFNSPNSTEMWMVGPTYQPPTSAMTGYYIPLTWAHLYSAANRQEGHGYTFFAASVDTRNWPNVLVYWVGWAMGPLSTIPLNSVGFVVVRSRINLAETPNFRTFTWATDTDVDIAVLYNDKYRPYHSTYRPYIIHDYADNKLFVVDPETTSIWSVNAPADGTSPISVNSGTFDLSHYGRMSGLNWHYYNEILYLGFTQDGSYNGSLIAVNLRSLTLLLKYDFNGYHNNPRAIAGVNNTLYIGFEGGPDIIKFDVNQWKIIGEVRLPDNLNQVYAAWDGGYDWVYFATYEQHSKVYRIHKQSFCPSGCPWDGWCEFSTCHCPKDYTLVDNGRRCEAPPAPKPAPDTVTADKSTAIAMGVLFAITFIAAVIGWIMFVRLRRGGNYQRVM